MVTVWLGDQDLMSEPLYQFCAATSEAPPHHMPPHTASQTPLQPHAPHAPWANESQSKASKSGRRPAWLPDALSRCSRRIKVPCELLLHMQQQKLHQEQSEQSAAAEEMVLGAMITSGGRPWMKSVVEMHLDNPGLLQKCAHASAPVHSADLPAHHPHTHEQAHRHIHEEVDAHEACQARQESPIQQQPTEHAQWSGAARRKARRIGVLTLAIKAFTPNSSATFRYASCHIQDAAPITRHTSHLCSTYVTCITFATWHRQAHGTLPAYACIGWID